MTTSFLRIFEIVFWQTAGINPVASEFKLIKVLMRCRVNSVIGLSAGKFWSCPYFVSQMGSVGPYSALVLFAD